MRIKKKELLRECGAHAKAAYEAGGKLITVYFPPLRLGLNSGCGAPTHVEGTNAGTMPCGSILNVRGMREPYYCALCSPRFNGVIKGQKGP